MSWIETVPYEAARDRLKLLYDRIRGPDGAIDNIMRAHSLRPHTLEGHMTLYKHVLHNSRNRTPRWLLEAVGVYVSRLNQCSYCVDHHYEGLRRLLKDDARARLMRDAFDADDPARAFEGPALAAMHYARLLTLTPAAVTEGEIGAMRSAGMSDGEILEINQVVSYFAYANRTVLGLGVTIRGDVLGLSPSGGDDPDDWGHV